MNKMNFKFLLAGFVVALALMPTAHSQRPNSFNLAAQLHAARTRTRTSTEPQTEDSPCEAGKECVPAYGCEMFQAEREKLTRLTPASDERKMLLEELQSQVCNKQEKKICCDNSCGNYVKIHGSRLEGVGKAYPEVTGFYKKQPGMVNGRAWYQSSNGYAIYLAGNGNWHINSKKKIGTLDSDIWKSGQAKCPHDDNNNWKYWNKNGPGQDDNQVMEDPTLRVDSVQPGSSTGMDQWTVPQLPQWTVPQLPQWTVPQLDLPSIPSKTCSVSQACDVSPIATKAEIKTVAECKKLCDDNKECNAITHFGPNSSPLPNFCMLFSNCSTLHDCSDCYSEDKRCFNSCDAKLKTKNNDGNLKTIFDVPDEPTCLVHCQGNPACRFFTYNLQSQTCILQSELSGPLQPCKHCRTGAVDCSSLGTGGFCFFSIGADITSLVTSYRFTKTGNTTVNILNLGTCELNAVAVGGGGHSHHGGGGSGYVANTTMTVSTSQLVVRVGGPMELSSLETSEGQAIIIAQPGGEAGGNICSQFVCNKGGSGYSGGGGGGTTTGGYGGQNGGHGHDGICNPDCEGGQGSDLDISSVPISSFLLTPGQGGRRIGVYGGGGGGVMVDGTGPQSTANANTGQGYGGGGGDKPRPGLVLLEIKPQQ